MAHLGIPTAYRTYLEELAGLDEAQAELLISDVGAVPAYAPATEIQAAATAAVGDSAGSLAASLLSLRGLFRTTTTEELSDLLSQSRDLHLDSVERGRLRDRVSALLATDSISTTSIAVDLQTQHQRNFQAARVFTDLRPVFADDIDQGPTGAVLTQMLQLQTWSRDGDSETIFVALDETDLQDLAKTIERAQAKTSALRSFLHEQGLGYFRLEKDDV